MKIIDISAAYESEKERRLRVLPRFGRVNLRETVLAPQKQRGEGGKSQLARASPVENAS